MKIDHENMIRESEKVVVRIDSSPPYCKDNLRSCGEKLEGNHVECYSSQEPQKSSQGGSLPCESAVGIYYDVSGSKDISPIADLNVEDCCDDIDMKETVDLKRSSL